MDPKKLFIDERLKGNCAHCGAGADSRDHIPSRVILDEPYPENLPVAESCSKCNGGFSADEEYLSCLIECVIHGTTEPNDRFREKVAKTLKARPSIAARIESGKSFDQNNNVIWQPEWASVREVVLKLARGHMSYELGLQHVEEPQIVDICPFPCFTEDELKRFNSLDEDSGLLYPEIGSRAFVNLLSGKPTAYEEWHVVQKGRYRYAVGQSSGDWVKFILSEYLACRVVWE
jgi:hypothetical protein